tara:strand:+ start:394 stop:720 length:327 start_codon:yes stop_codon:yes gene_type:complete
MIYKLVSSDTAPQIKATITREDDGSVVNMSGATVVLKFRAQYSTTILFELTSSSAGSSLQNGIAIFTFNAGNLDIATGMYEGEIEITYSNGVKETLYEILEFHVRADF